MGGGVNEVRADFGGSEEGAPEDDDSKSQEDSSAPSRGDAKEAQQAEEEKPQGFRDANPDGPPCALLVKQEGEMCSFVTFDREGADRELLYLMNLRQELIIENREKFIDDCLSYDVATAGMRKLEERWLQRSDTQATEQEIWSRPGVTHERANRTLASNFRTWIYVTYGGKAWVHWFLMLGYVPDLLIQL